MKKITLTSFPSGAENAKGTVIIIDVFRAFTTASYAFAAGAAEIVMVGELEEAATLKSSGRVDLLIGERKGLRPEGFDFGNSPTAVSELDLKGKRIAQTTTNGTAGLVAAAKASQLYAGALVNARATAIAAEGAKDLTIVAAGREGIQRADEDEICAIYMRSVAAGWPHDADALTALAKAWWGNEEFLTSREQYGPRTDWALALEVDRFDFAIRVTAEEGLLVARAK